MRLVGDENRSMPHWTTHGPSMSKSRATKTYVSCQDMVSSDTHTWSSRASSQTQFTSLQITAFVLIHMHAANLEPTQSSSSSHHHSTSKVRQNCLKTCSLVIWALSLGSRFGHVLPVFRSNSVFVAVRSSEVKGTASQACPPITGPGSNCQNMLTSLQP